MTRLLGAPVLCAVSSDGAEAGELFGRGAQQKVPPTLRLLELDVAAMVRVLHGGEDTSEGGEFGATRGAGGSSSGRGGSGGGGGSHSDDFRRVDSVDSDGGGGGASYLHGLEGLLDLQSLEGTYTRPPLSLT
jgi:hypothetical protein